MAARHRLDAAASGVGEARSAYFPRIYGLAGYFRTQDPVFSFLFLLRQRSFSFASNPNQPEQVQDLNLQALAIWPLFNGWADTERFFASRDARDAAEHEVAASGDALAEAAARSFYGLAKAEELVPVAAESLAAIDVALDSARAREAEGKALRSDVLLLEVKRAEASDALGSTKRMVEIARAELLALLDVPLDTSVVLETDSVAAVSTPDETMARETALDTRPELRAARSRASAFEHAATAASREANPLIPSIYGFGTYGVDSKNIYFSSERDNWTVGALAIWNIFSGGQDWYRAQRAEADAAEARDHVRERELEVSVEVRRAIVTLDDAASRVATTGGAVRAAEEALRNIREQYLVGAATVSRYLEIEVALREARARAVSARYDLRIAQIALERALGTLGRQ
jgi:outer membrane protein TolC